MEELLAAISSEELTEWMAYAQLDPFGSYRSDLAAAIVASTVANVHATKDKVFKTSEFMPSFEPAKPTPAMSPDAMKAMLIGRFGQRKPRG